VFGGLDEHSIFGGFFLLFLKKRGLYDTAIFAMQAQDGDHGFEKMIAVGGAFVDTNDCHHDFGKVSYVPFTHSVTLALSVVE